MTFFFKFQYQLKIQVGFFYVKKGLDKSSLYFRLIIKFTLGSYLRLVNLIDSIISNDCRILFFSGKLKILQSLELN